MLILTEKYITPCWYKVRNQIWMKGCNQITEQVNFLIKNQVWNQVWHQVDGQPFNQVRRQIYVNNNRKVY